MWLGEATNDAFRMFIVLGKVGVSLSQEAGGAITLLYLFLWPSLLHRVLWALS